MDGWKIRWMCERMDERMYGRTGAEGWLAWLGCILGTRSDAMRCVARNGGVRIGVPIASIGIGGTGGGWTRWCVRARWGGMRVPASNVRQRREASVRPSAGLLSSVSVKVLFRSSTLLPTWDVHTMPPSAV